MVRDHEAVNDKALALVKKLEGHAEVERDQRSADEAGRGDEEAACQR